MADGGETAEYDITLDLNLYTRCLMRSHNEPLQSEPRELKACEKRQIFSDPTRCYSLVIEHRGDSMTIPEGKSDGKCKGDRGREERKESSPKVHLEEFALLPYQGEILQLVA